MLSERTASAAHQNSTGKLYRPPFIIFQKKFSFPSKSSMLFKPETPEKFVRFVMKPTLCFYFHRHETVMTICENCFRSDEWRVSPLCAFVLDPKIFFKTRFLLLAENRFLYERIRKAFIRQNLLSSSDPYDFALQWNCPSHWTGEIANSTILYQSRPYFTQDIWTRIHAFAGRIDGHLTWNGPEHC